MAEKIVTTQTELSAAYAALGRFDRIVVESTVRVEVHGRPEGPVVASGSATVEASGSATVRASGSATVRASDSATVRASGSATVVASGSATVVAYDSATVVASGSATVVASGSATVVASGSATVEASGSATVRASGSATVRAYDSATVRAYDSATVRASGSATVVASGSATVVAYDSATVEASGSATVRAYDSATVVAYDSATVRAYGASRVRVRGSAKVTATDQVVIQDHEPDQPTEGRLTGGVIIPIRQPKTAADWCSWHGVTVADGIATLYKAVGNDWRGPRKTSVTYRPGQTPAAPDWDGGKRECGGGLHFSPRPAAARNFMPDAAHYLACPVALADIAVHPDGDYPEKIKARACSGPVVECDIHGTPIPVPTAEAAS